MKIRQNRIVRFYETGNADVLKIEPSALPEPGKDEIRIKVEAIGLNRAEIMFREGKYLETPDLPSRLGYEASGIIDAVGSSVSDLVVGDQVSTIPAFSLSKYGVYGETAIVPASAIALYPENLTAIEASSIWMQYITAYGALIDIAKIEKDSTIIITAASSSVGIAAIQVAKMMQASVIAVTRSKNKKDFLLENGADHVVVTNEENLIASLMNLTDAQGFDLAFDPIGGPMLSTLAEAAANEAMIIEYGALSTEQTIYPLFSALAKSLNIRGYVLFEMTKNHKKLSQAKEFIYSGLAAGKLKPVIDRVFKFDQIADAHRYMESNIQLGKIVVEV